MYLIYQFYRNHLVKANFREIRFSLDYFSRRFVIAGRNFDLSHMIKFLWIVNFQQLCVDFNSVVSVVAIYIYIYIIYIFILYIYIYIIYIYLYYIYIYIYFVQIPYQWWRQKDLLHCNITEVEIYQSTWSLIYTRKQQNCFLQKLKLQ